MEHVDRTHPRGSNCPACGSGIVTGQRDVIPAVGASNEEAVAYEWICEMCGHEWVRGHVEEKHAILG